MKWKLLQTGISLFIGNIKIFEISEIPFNDCSLYRIKNNIFKLKLDGTWIDVNVHGASILEMIFVIEDFTFYFKDKNNKKLICTNKINFTTIAKLLALTVDHIDLLLEDWYPALGTRFVHTSEGRLLITRLIACPKCFEKMTERQITLPTETDAKIGININPVLSKDNFEDLEENLNEDISFIPQTNRTTFGVSLQNTIIKAKKLHKNQNKH